jgi:Ca2+:H+ antiporter
MEPQITVSSQCGEDEMVSVAVAAETPPPEIPTALVESEEESKKEIHPVGGFLSLLSELCFGSKLNILCICIPIAFITASAGGPGGLLFTASFLALIPLAAALGDLTEDLALRTNDAIGALINVTFGNATELIVSIAALSKGEYELIKMTLVGSVIGNMLLVLGTSLIVCGIKNPIVAMNSDAARTYSSMLFFGAFAIVIPTALSTLSESRGGRDDDFYALEVSQHISLLVAALYGLYIYFQLKSHKFMFDGAEDSEEPDEDEEPKFSFVFAFVGVGVVAVLISMLSDYLVGTVQAAAETFHLSYHFIGLVLIPIVGNVAEHASAILMANKGKMDIAVGVALGSSIQIEMFAFPVMVLIAWMGGYPLDMQLSPFLMLTLFMGIVITHAIIAEGSATWLGGSKMVAAYLLLGIAFLDAPNPSAK